MLDWLQKTFKHAADVPLEDAALRLGLALVVGCAVSGIYRLTHRGDTTITPTMVPALVLLSILIAMVTQVIGDNLGRAFSLVGALAIIRFRTVIEDTRDTAFVIFAVVEGMAVGAGYLTVAGVGLVAVGIAAVFIRPGKKPKRVGGKFWALSVRVGLAQSSAFNMDALLAKHLEEWQQLAAATGRQGAALDLTYRVRFRPNTTATALVHDLNHVEGVQSAEVRQL